MSSTTTHAGPDRRTPKSSPGELPAFVSDANVMMPRVIPTFCRNAAGPGTGT